MAALKNWTVVVVGDKKSAVDETYSVSNVVFLSVTAQEELAYPIQLPYNSYARKIIGYLYAIQHGATTIYESDDDNMPIADLSGFLAAREKILHYIPKTAAELDSEAPYPVVNPYAHFGHPSIWPRGYPLDALNLEQQELFQVEEGNTWIQQSLANGDPDVDAVFRLTRKLHHKPIDITFDSSAPSVALPAGTFCPYNSQNTLHHYPAFWALFIPGSVSFRVSDIWRSYWAQRLLWEVAGVVSFLPPFVYQERNAHNYIKDFEEEQQLYTQSGALIQFLSKWRPAARSRKFVDVILQLSEDMAVAGFWDQSDAALVAQWCKALEQLGYQFPVLQQQQQQVSAVAASAPPPIRLSRVQEHATGLQGVQQLAAGEENEREKVILFICILVSPVELSYRNVLRETYLSLIPDLPVGSVAYKFFTDYRNNEEQLKLLEEEQQYGDLQISASFHCTHKGNCHNSLNIVTEALSWTVEHYDFTYFLRLDSDGYLCLPQLLKTLENRPRDRYITGFYGCKLSKSNSFFRADEAFLLFTQDIAAMYVQNLPLIRRSPSTTFALNFGAFTFLLNIVMEDIPWGPEIKKVCDPFLFIHKQKDVKDIRLSHDTAVARLAASGVKTTEYKPLCKVERVDAGKPEVAITNGFFGRQYVDARHHWETV
jgi:hypothetical protein